MWSRTEGFSFMRRGKAQSAAEGMDTPAASSSPRRGSPPGSNKSGITMPSVRLSLDRKGYRPGDMVVATIEVANENPSYSSARRTPRASVADAVLMEDLSVEVRGIEKLDPQWLVTPKPPSGSKQRRGERIILESSSTSIVSNVLIGHGTSKTYMVRMMLPKILPPTYRGTAVRYLYYLSSTLHWSPAVVENGNGHHSASVSGLEPVEVRMSVPVWTMPNSSGLVSEELQAGDHYGSNGIVPPFPLEIEIQWKEKGDEYSWAWASDLNFGFEDNRGSGHDSESSTMTSPTKSGSLEPAFERALSFSSQPATPKSLGKDTMEPALPTPHLKKTDEFMPSSSQLSFDSGSKVESQHFQNGRDFSEKRVRGSGSLASESFHSTMNGYHMNGMESAYVGRAEEDVGIGSPQSPAVTYNRGRSYNIKMDDQVLVRFSPKNVTSTYYYGDMVAGTLQFFHDEGPRRCLEVSAVLETREVLNPSSVHPSRKNSSTITKVQSEYYEVVCDMTNTHFVFSVPMDGPPSFSTPLLTVQWILRFEFVASLPDVNWSEVEHPMLLELEQRRKGEWSMPLTVHAPLPRTHTAGAAKSRKERGGDLWVGPTDRTLLNSLPIVQDLHCERMALKDGSQNQVSSSPVVVLHLWSITTTAIQQMVLSSKWKKWSPREEKDDVECSLLSSKFWKVLAELQGILPPTN